MPGRGSALSTPSDHVTDRQIARLRCVLTTKHFRRHLLVTDLTDPCGRRATPRFALLGVEWWGWANCGNDRKSGQGLNLPGDMDLSAKIPSE